MTHLATFLRPLFSPLFSQRGCSLERGENGLSYGSIHPLRIDGSGSSLKGIILRSTGQGHRRCTLAEVAYWPRVAAITGELRPCEWPPISEIRQQPCRFAVRRTPTALSECNCKQMKWVSCAKTMAQLGQLPDRGWLHSHIVFFPPQILGMLPEDENQITLTCSGMLLQCLTFSINWIRTLPRSASFQCLFDSQGKPQGCSRDLIIGGPRQLAPLTRDQVEQGGVMRTT